MPETLTAAADMRAYYEEGESVAQLVALLPGGRAVHVMDVPMRSPGQPGSTYGVMVDGKRWIPCEPRPAHHPQPW